MPDLIKGEVYRLLRKRSMYIYFCGLAIGYFIISFIRSSGFDAAAIVNDANSFIGIAPALAGGFLFTAICTDDLSSKNLITLVGFGISKVKIVIFKFALMAIFSAAVFCLLPLQLYIVHALLGWQAAGSVMATVYAISLQYLLMTIAYAALAGIAVYGLQNATFSLVLYVLLSFNIVGGMISLALRIDFLQEHLMSGISGRIMLGILHGSPLASPVLEYILYVAISLILSAIAFHKKEMEF